MPDQPVYVQAGDKINIPIRSGNETLIWDTVVADVCPNDRGGYWYCDTCRESLAHNMAASSHVGPEHRLAWICYEHGPETVKAQ